MSVSGDSVMSKLKVMRPSGGGVEDSEAGDTLVEVLITLVIVSLCVVAFLSAFSTSISASAEHRTLVSIDTVLRSASENALSQIEQDSSPLFSACATPSTYSGINFGIPSGYVATITSVEYWNGSSFSTACASGSTAPQLISLTVSGPLGSSSSISFSVDDPQYAAQGAASASFVAGVAQDGVASSTLVYIQPTLDSGSSYSCGSEISAEAVPACVTVT